ncbi:IgGFc-binding protein [Nannocystis punicea]|uniref:IgGFc-binding protein n=1 Tax=Nannocystis punicea TaxID=2995304 RepID=A0ABY7HIU6_9BACT|nr:IgGFc-binding protein [Nannocystis poenicansa]WAS99253.1 IgGFc-binding protein [Nannocystis poenicansa]
MSVSEASGVSGQSTASSLTGPTSSGADTTGSTAAPTTSGASASGSTSTTGTGTDATTDEETSSSTGAPVTSSTSTTTTTDGPGETTLPCDCTPGETAECEGKDILVCQDDCMTFAPEACPPGTTCNGGACAASFCKPGTKTCEDDDSFKQCNGDGSAYDPPVDCGEFEGCSLGDCYALCDLVLQTPSTVGCSFFANRMDNYYGDQSDSLVVGNTHKTKTATVQLYLAPTGQNVEQPQGAPVMIAPGQTYTFTLTNPPIDKVSTLRKGGAYRIDSNVPVVAYQHSPIGSQATNDASMMFPEHALQANYIVASYKQSQANSPSYFNVIAAADNTTVSWTPPVNTLGGGGVPAVTAGQTGQVVLNRYDTLQVVAPNPPGDLSGTIVTADKPISVIGANECVNVPNINTLYCDHVEEQMLPLEYWGMTYVGAASPKRGNEKHYWRVYGGEDGTVVTTVPAQPGTPMNLNKGQWQELVVPNGTSFIFEGNKPFLPVQYLEGQNGGAGTGDPAMYQMIPVEQYLDRYAFATGTNYAQHYAQIIRVQGAPDVLIDGAVVSGYTVVGGYEVADWKISEGPHLAESAQPFGILNIGYTPVTSYAYPGGTRLKVINPQ